ncbi:MAG: DUF4129 domain-containing protein [Leptolyngbyaceae cyanobacterium MO_188.B28]|nr:DUF4129 domain-containing protein [Leptolyngbyaceae cyanobacterium MO_188.B28]
MAAGSFQKSSVGWQLQQFGRRVGEWLELNFLQGSDDPTDQPIWSAPTWLEKGLFWLLVAVLLTWISWRVYKLAKVYLRNWRSGAWKGVKLGGMGAGRSDVTVAAWLRRAEESQQQGRYGEACRALYMAMLQRLHDTQTILNQPSRTDGEYLQLVRQFSQPRPYQLLIQTHERFYFGDLAATAETFQRCKRAYQEIAKQ